MMTDMTTEMGVSFKMKFTEPELTGAVILWLSTASAEFLRGRFVSVNWKVNELEAMKDDIVRHKLLKSAFNAKLGK